MPLPQASLVNDSRGLALNAANRMGLAATVAAILAACAFAVAFVPGGLLGLVTGAFLLLGSVAAMGGAVLAGRSVTRKVEALRARVEALAQGSDSAGGLEPVAAADEVDALQNVVARLASSTNEPLQALSAAAERIASGDLTVDVRGDDNGASADLVKRFVRMRDSLKQLVGEVQASSLDVTSSAEELSAAIEEISSSIEEVSATITQVSQGAQSQSEQVGQASHSLRETAQQLQKTAAEAKDAAARVREANASSTEGARSAADASRRIEEITLRVDQTADMVRGFAENISRISEFVKVIVRISDQTNLLALNAAIEAARAGEHGRGFTVVADEVRKLAEESAQGAEEVQRVISSVTAETARIVATMEAMTKEVKQGDDVVRQAIGRFEDITQQVSSISTLVARMADSVDQMASRGADIAKNVESVSASAEETAASAEEVSAAIQQQTASIEQVASTSQNLARNASQALESTRRFRTGEAAAAPKPARAPTDMPPIFRAPPREAPERRRIALTKYGEEKARERAGG